MNIALTFGMESKGGVEVHTCLDACKSGIEIQLHVNARLASRGTPVLPRGPASSYVVGRVQEEEGRRARGSEGRPPRPVMRRSGADATREEDVATDKMKRRGVRRNPRGGEGARRSGGGGGRPPRGGYAPTTTRDGGNAVWCGLGDGGNQKDRVRECRSIRRGRAPN
jgi:hypothetical protein